MIPKYLFWMKNLAIFLFSLILKEEVRVEIYFEDMTLLKNFRLDSGDIILKENLKYIEITN